MLARLLPQQEEQCETARELTDILRIAQEMTQRLANETHGDLYAEVKTLNDQLHQARSQLDKINKSLPLF